MENEQPVTHRNPMQPASHRVSHTRPDSAQTRHRVLAADASTCVKHIKDGVSGNLTYEDSRGCDRCIGNHTLGPATAVTRAASSASRTVAAYVFHMCSRFVTDVRNPSAMEQAWLTAVRPIYTHAYSTVVRPGMPLRSSHLVLNHISNSRERAVHSTYSLCETHILPGRMSVWPS